MLRGELFLPVATDTDARRSDQRSDAVRLEFTPEYIPGVSDASDTRAASGQ
jgi:hypothetical protein